MKMFTLPSKISVLTFALIFFVAISSFALCPNDERSIEDPLVVPCKTNNVK